MRYLGIHDVDHFGPASQRKFAQRVVHFIGLASGRISGETNESYLGAVANRDSP